MFNTVLIFADLKKGEKQNVTAQWLYEYFHYR